MNIPFISREQLQSIEMGYKGIFWGRYLIDVSGYVNRYEDFIGQQGVISANATEHQGNVIDAGTLFRPYLNSPEVIYAQGVNVQNSYRILHGLWAHANYSWAGSSNPSNNSFVPPFNTPRHRANLSCSVDRLWGNLGASFSYRWQDSFVWQSTFGTWRVPTFGTLNGQVNYLIDRAKVMVKVGGTNLLGGDYRTHFGSSFIGQQYYVSLVFNNDF